ncbi:GNAT family N-acetyltransferase [Nocardiopsis sp. HNM0947]|uniref:GNAT family N-acetyltransferase n=1 Tax=Nocardiopsis coralli TaxID=2772213 RepID=A0ABR9P6P0_9ACTN|nr:GNAT family N-acetyltransferase [Nocardiopsis coralli]MBE2999520.1 GNAT family N-acetyltransferase [Nocardiopsis coralli]
MQACSEHITHLAGVWAHGWALSRGVAPPTALGRAHRLEVGLPQHRVRYVVACGRDLASHAPAWTGPGTVVKAFLSGPETEAVLGPRWRVGEGEVLMSADLSAGCDPAPEPYRIQVQSQGATHRALALAPDGRVAAEAWAALHAGHAVFDRVVTDPEHRRRGLGRALMGALGRISAGQGAHTGVLVATEDGRALYTALGWSVVCEVTPALLPEGALTAP